MLDIEEIVLSELNDREEGLPPGFRFHPTDEELITFYLASKVFHGSLCGVEIAEVDLNRCEPWQLPNVAKMGEREWYFFSLRDRKYPTGLRTNRATGAGYWKATGKDRQVCGGSSGAVLGMKKTLVFYKGRAPRGEKTKWVMHEYRLDGHFSYPHTHTHTHSSCATTTTTNKVEWVICRIYNKAAAAAGEKKDGVVHDLQGEGTYMFGFEGAAAGSCLPALLDAPPADAETTTNSQSHHDIYQQNPILKGNLNNPFVIQQQLENQDHDLLLPISTNDNNNGLFEYETNNSTSPSASMLFKSLLSHQDFSCINEFAAASTIPKHCCNTEANFPRFQLPPPAATDTADNKNISTTSMGNKSQPFPFPNPLFFEFDRSFPAPTQPYYFAYSSASATDLSTSSVGFNRTGIQVIESWPSDP